MPTTAIATAVIATWNKAHLLKGNRTHQQIEPFSRAWPSILSPKSSLVEPPAIFGTPRGITSRLPVLADDILNAMGFGWFTQADPAPEMAEKQVPNLQSV